jgi:predicted glycoside hydrolase/deacetylase ChbG (UPF0249 family)
VSFEVLSRILANELPHGINELGCHPGYFDPDFQCVYHKDREYELRTLCDKRGRELLQQLDIELIGYRDVRRAQNRLAGNGQLHGVS